MSHLIYKNHMSVITDKSLGSPTITKDGVTVAQDIELEGKFENMDSKMIKKTLKKFQFVVPNTRWFGKRAWTFDAPGVTILAPLVKKQGYEVDILEANLDNLNPKEVMKRIEEFKPDVVGLSNLSIEYWQQLHEAARLTKKVNKDTVVIAGGVHVTTLPERAMEDKNIDYVVLSEGEVRLFDLLEIIKKDDGDFSSMNGILYRDKEGKVIKIKSDGSWYGTKFNGTLDDLYPPDLSLYKNPEKIFNGQSKAAGGMSTRRNPAAPILTSRGCPYHCSFCAAPVTTGQKMRFRSPENVMKEIDTLVYKYGVKEVIFQDDEMYASVKRATQIIQMIKDRKYPDLIWKNLNIASWRMTFDLIKLMKESGCYQITISAESGNPRVLKEIIHKPTDIEMAKKVVAWCKEVGIETQVDFIIGFPGETWDEIRDTTNYAYEIDADSVKFAVATPFPGTELMQQAVMHGMFPADYDFYTNDYLGFANPTMNSKDWTARDLKIIRVMEWDRINFRTEEKKKRYARLNELTIEEVEKFREETRKNLGIYFIDTEKRDDESQKVVTQENQNWDFIKKTAAFQASISNQGHTHEII